MVISQAQRSVQIGQIAGSEFVLTSMRGEEEISGLFSFWLELVSEDISVMAESVIGQNVSFNVSYGDDAPRFFNGYVRRFIVGGLDLKNHRYYRAEVVPWLWFLTQNSDCRIFQDKTAVEIIEGIFKDRGFADFAVHLKSQHTPREYCVQYRETDFNFVSRLMEEEGISYYFQHENGKHILVLVDSSDLFPECPDSIIDLTHSSQGTFEPGPHLRSWQHEYQFRPGRWAHADYNFKTPKTRLVTPEKTLLQVPHASKYEYFDYPGVFEEKSRGSQLARVRMEELESEYNTIQATSTCKSFSAGHKFTLGRHRILSESNNSYTIRRISHFAQDNVYTTGEDSGPTYENQFECFPSACSFRPPRLTSKPLMGGCQTAVVTGPADEEIYPDEFGRVKVQFHWDRRGHFDEKSSCWIRVSQTHAGKGWGYIDLPRVGEEVIVDFLEGDPDRPIITGRVYNAYNKPPFELPAKKTRRGFTTRTYKGVGYNELSMDDTKGAEQIRIHAQRDMNTVVENDQTTNVNHNRIDVVKVNDQLTVHGNQTREVFGGRKQIIHKNEACQVKGNRDKIVDAENKEKYGGDFHLHICGDRLAATDGNDHLTVGGEKHEKIGRVYAVSSGQEVHIKAGMKIIIEAGMQISLVGPGGFIDIGPAGVTIQGTMVKVNSGGAAGSGTDAAPTNPTDPQID